MFCWLVSDKDNLAVAPKHLFQSFILYNVRNVKPPRLFLSFYQSVFKSDCRLWACSEERLSSAETPKRDLASRWGHVNTAETLVTHRKLERLKQGSSWGDTWQNIELQHEGHCCANSSFDSVMLIMCTTRRLTIRMQPFISTQHKNQLADLWNLLNQCTITAYINLASFLSKLHFCRLIWKVIMQYNNNNNVTC